MDENWTITPLTGLGQLRFGLTRAQITALAEIYGAPEAGVSDAEIAASMESTLELLGDALSVEDREFLMAQADSQASSGGSRLVLSDSLLALDLTDGALTGITLGTNHADAHLAETRRFLRPTLPPSWRFSKSKTAAPASTAAPARGSTRWRSPSTA